MGRECKIILNGEEMEEINELKYLGSVMCKNVGTEGETRERALQGGKVVGSLGEAPGDRRLILAPDASDWLFSSASVIGSLRLPSLSFIFPLF